MPDTFPAIAPDTKSKRQRAARILQADFGDGYAQAGPDGINTTVENWDLSFENYPISDVTTLTAFLDAQASYKSFYWTPPNEATPKLWRQDGDYTVGYPGPLTRSLSVKIKRVYSL
ncbi:phage tail protein [Cypionkella sp.]|uniref:phage tail protein n=1 Tax=Cypionkella sp. TaxID=2811411 RepID=UPI002724BF01|nr:phage tail protein [Cypionkella sp.]MDO8985797.1 phage tail protein [Cypionkella sp.]MDP2051377.1 phage tail protein [Cypionkella sp.]